MKKSVIVLSVVSIFILAGMFFNFIFAESSSSSVSFSTNSIVCEKTLTTAIWRNTSSGQTFPVTSSGNCSLFSSLPLLPSCCPLGQTCNFRTGACTESFVTRCDQYPDQAACTADDLGVGINSVVNSSVCGTHSPYYINSLGENCVNYTSCGCFWNSTLSNCTARVFKASNCNNTITTFGTCVWLPSTITNNCNNSLKNIVISSVARWTPGSGLSPAELDCRDITRTRSCVATAKLDFISNLSLVIIVLLIIIIYFWLNRKLKLKTKKS